MILSSRDYLASRKGTCLRQQLNLAGEELLRGSAPGEPHSWRYELGCEKREYGCWIKDSGSRSHDYR